MGTNGTDRLSGAYAEQGDRLRSWLAAHAGEEDAEDILQDVFARAFSNLDALEPVRDLAGWLWRVAANALRDHWRSAARKRRHLEPDPPELDDIVADAGWDHADRMDRERLLATLAESIRALPEGQRLVIEAQTLGGESFRSLSERTGIPADTLASRKRYALARIRSDLSSHRKE